jgi:hypothetical protein
MPHPFDGLKDEYVAWQADLFSYPGRPGWKEGTTSRAAAIAAAPTSLKRRGAIFRAFEAASPGGLTADEAGERCAMTPFSARPRVTELVLAGKIEDTGARRKNVSGRKAKVYRVKRRES